MIGRAIARAAVRGLVLGALVPSLAAAQQPVAAPAEPAAVVAGREAFTRGAELARRGVWVDALAAFEESARLRGHPVTTYNVAFSERALGHLTRARWRFGQALDEHLAAQGGTLTPELALAAGQYAAELDGKILRVQVALDAADTAIAIDGRTLAIADAGACVLVAGTGEPAPPAAVPCPAFTLEIDPGEHTMLLRRSGAPDRISRLRLDEDSTTLRLEGPRPPAPAPVVARPPPPRGRARPAGLALIGSGAALTAISAVTGALFVTNRNALEQVCVAGECPSDRAAQIRRTNGLGAATWVLLGTGVTSLGVGAALVAVGRSASGRLAVTPTVGLRAIGLHARF